MPCRFRSHRPLPRPLPSRTQGQPDGGMQDPSELFGSLFGGEAFHDLIGDLSMLKDMMGQAEVMMYGPLCASLSTPTRR